VLVTGATGFLGRHLLRRLSEEHDVIGMARNIPLHADFPHVRGDVTEPTSLAPALDGVEAVVHAAGNVSHLPADAGRTWDVHVKGTTSLLDAASAAGVRRVVHLSSSGTVAVSTRPEVLGEDAPSPLPIIGTWPYYRAKLFSEQLALSRSRPGFEVLSLNPSLLLGPGDLKHESTRSVVLFLQGQLSAAPSGGVSFVDVRDVALAAARALSRGTPGQRYLLTGANWSWTEPAGRADGPATAAADGARRHPPRPGLDPRRPPRERGAPPADLAARARAGQPLLVRGRPQGPPRAGLDLARPDGDPAGHGPRRLRPATAPAPR
jgi:dihydroflavonol-4-reductase